MNIESFYFLPIQYTSNKYISVGNMRPYVRRQLALPTVGGADGAPLSYTYEMNKNGFKRDVEGAVPYSVTLNQINIDV